MNIDPACLADNQDNLHVVVTDFNGFDQTRRCLQALRISQFQHFTTLVVDHGNDGRTRVGLTQEFPEVIRIEGSPILWWTGATNLGIQAALAQGAKKVMLLNNDCYVTPETLDTLLRQAQKHPCAIIAPIQRDWHTGKVTSIGLRSFFLLGFPTVPCPRTLTTTMAKQELLPVDLIGGGRGVILSSASFARLGLFDASAFPHYYADHDFYLRARRQGIPLYVATRAYVDIDDSHTSLANRPEALTLRKFIHSLRSTQSHRNLRDITTLFRRHYLSRPV